MNTLNNNSLVRPTVRWQQAFVACFLWLLFAGSAGAVTVSWAELPSIDDSSSEMAMADVHAIHKMDSASNPCENRNCKQSAECAMSCVIGGGCSSPSVVGLPNLTIDTRTFQMERLPNILPSAFVSRQVDSLFRPPIQ